MNILCVLLKILNHVICVCGQWHDMGITSRTLRTLEKRPSGDENSIGKLPKLHGAIEDMLVQ